MSFRPEDRSSCCFGVGACQEASGSQLPWLLRTSRKDDCRTSLRGGPEVERLDGWTHPVKIQVNYAEREHAKVVRDELTEAPRTSALHAGAGRLELDVSRPAAKASTTGRSTDGDALPMQTRRDNRDNILGVSLEYKADHCLHPALSAGRCRPSFAYAA